MLRFIGTASFYFDLYSLTSICQAIAFPIGETVVLNVEAMLSNVTDVEMRAGYRVWHTLAKVTERSQTFCFIRIWAFNGNGGKT